LKQNIIKEVIENNKWHTIFRLKRCGEFLKEIIVIGVSKDMMHQENMRIID